MAGQRRSTHLLCGQIHVRCSSGDDEAIAEFAVRVHGVATRGQLLDLGISRRAIEHRLKRGRLRRLFPGVYAVGHEALTPAGWALAAVAAVWPAAAASLWSATALHGLTDRQRRPIHVSANASRRPQRGLVVHRAVLPDEDVTFVRGVPVTTVARTLLDMSAVTDERRLRTMIKRAEFKGLVDAGDLVAILDRYPVRRGRGVLARIVDGYALRTGTTRSPIEDDFVEFCAFRKLPLPSTNVRLGLGDRLVVVDCLWLDTRLVVELDGRAAHDRHLAFEDDRARDRALTAAGYRPMRATSRQIRHQAAELEADLRAVLMPDESRSTHPGGD